MKKGTIILMTMLAMTAVAIGFGVYVIRQRINTQPLIQNQTPSDQTKPADQTPTPADTSPLSSTAGWKTYTNDKHGFTMQYPPYLDAGAVSDNSVLGTYSSPVRGLHVGPLVLIALEDKDLKKQAQDYFDSLYQAALTPPKTPVPSDAGATACVVDKASNPNVVSIKSVSCTGEGGAGRYAYLSGKTFDVFIDGYSKGFDNSNSPDFATTADYLTALSTFVFTKDGPAAATPNAGPGTSATGNGTTPADASLAPNDNPTSAVQTFSIVADDSGATPSIISVPAGTIVEISFNVSSQNVSHGGLDFRSPTINTGTVFSGQSKTISFTAAKSFDFTPYWSDTNTAKTYKVSVQVQ